MSLSQKVAKLLMSINETVTDTDVRSVWEIATSSGFSRQKKD